jgi:hypothetical protein
MAYDVFQ